MPRWLFFDDAITPPTIVGSEKASTPTTETAQAGSTVVIPVPSGVQEGDLLLAIATWAQAGTLTEPLGWTNIIADPIASTKLSKRVATSSEPADYSWSHTIADQGRSGCMIAIRGANSTLGDNDIQNVSFTVPDLTNNIEDSILVGFHAGSSLLGESYIANSPLILQTQHVGQGDGPYALIGCVALAVEEGLSTGLISGRSFSDPDNSGSRNAYGIIVEGV